MKTSKYNDKHVLEINAANISRNQVQSIKTPKIF